MKNNWMLGSIILLDVEKPCCVCAITILMSSKSLYAISVLMQNSTHVVTIITRHFFTFTVIEKEEN